MLLEKDVYIVLHSCYAHLVLVPKLGIRLQTGKGGTWLVTSPTQDCLHTNSEIKEMKLCGFLIRDLV